MENSADLFLLTSAASLVLGGEGAVLRVNPAAVRLLGATSDDALLGRRFAEFLSHESHPHESDWRRVLVAGEQNSSEAEFQLKRCDGERIDVVCRATLVERQDPTALLVVIEDVTSVRRLEREADQLRDYARRSQRLEAVGSLTGGIAHDFNNMLSAILGYSELSVDMLTPAHPVIANLEEVLAAGRQAKELVDQILNFSRPSDRQCFVINPARVLKDALKLLRHSIPATIRIEQHIDVRGETIFAELTEIHQVVVNLCMNAAQAMQNRGGLIRVSLDALDLNPAPGNSHFLLGPGRYMRMTVEDDCPRFDNVLSEDIFKASLTTLPDGSIGVGLALVRDIVRAHKGDIFVSILPSGTQFRVFLPVLRPDARQSDETNMNPLPRGSEHVLLVDDEESLVRLAKRALTRLGYRVTSISSSEEALEVFRADPGAFNVVVTDQTMPVMTGSELAGALLEIRPDIPIILCTGYSAHITRRQAEELGIKRFLMKPFRMLQLAEEIRQLVDRQPS